MSRQTRVIARLRASDERSQFLRVQESGRIGLRGRVHREPQYGDRGDRQTDMCRSHDRPTSLVTQVTSKTACSDRNVVVTAVVWLLMELPHMRSPGGRSRLNDLDSESGYKRSLFERAPMLRFPAEAKTSSKSAELIGGNRCRVLLLQASLDSSHLLFDECGLVGHHGSAAFRVSNDRHHGSVFVVARARARPGRVTSDKAQQPCLLPNGQRQRDGNDTCSNHGITHHSTRQERGQR